ncbi:MAG: hypothetical protein ACREF3_10375, partial [Acetobacteraceae bacterium]
LEAYGGSNTVGSGAGELVGINNTNGAPDTVNATGDQFGGTAVSGYSTGIWLGNNVQVNLFGSSDGVVLTTGDSLSSYGGSNTVDSGAGEFVGVDNTNDAPDTVNATGDQFGGTAAVRCARRVLRRCDSRSFAFNAMLNRSCGSSVNPSARFRSTGAEDARLGRPAAFRIMIVDKSPITET